jgi:small-conductance mechanosensitive channel
VTNWTYGDRSRRIGIPFGVAYGSDKNEVREAALAAAESVEGLIIDEQHPVAVLLKAFGESSLDFEARVWVGPELVTRPGGTTSRFLWALEDELTKRGIEIPYPTRDVNLRSGPIAVKLEGADETPARDTNAQPHARSA